MQKVQNFSEKERTCKICVRQKLQTFPKKEKNMRNLREAIFSIR